MSEPIRQPGREQAALREIGHTTISRALAWGLTVAFLATIFSVPLIQNVHEVAEHLSGRRESAVPGCLEIFRAGPRAVASAQSKPGPFGSLRGANAALLREIHRFEDALEEDSVTSQAIQPPAQAVLTGWLGAGNEQAYVGTDGWLFYRPGIDYLTGPGFLQPRQLARRADEGSEWAPAPQPDPTKAIGQFHRQLARRGIRLIVMPTPGKASVHGEFFSGRYSDHTGYPHSRPLQNPSFAKFVAALEREGVVVLDVAESLVGAKLDSGPGRGHHPPQYIATDTHWRPEAMALAAGALARCINEHVKLAPVRPAGLKREAAEVSCLGDITVMLNLPAGQKLYPPETVRIQQVLTARGELWRPTESADVLVLGDSFSNIYSLETMGWGGSAGLVEQVSFLLQRPVDRIVRNSDGAFAARQALGRELAQGRDRLAGKKVVVWQFAARELFVGDWKLMNMTLGEARPGRFFVPAPGSERIVSGTVRAVSLAPRPARVPYRDHIVAVHLIDVETADGTVGGREAVVYVWSMREKVLTAAARYREGQRVRLRIRPWADVADEHGRINRSELDSEELLGEEPCWGEEVR